MKNSGAEPNRLSPKNKDIVGFFNVASLLAKKFC